MDIQQFNTPDEYFPNIPDEETQRQMDADMADDDYIQAFNDWFDSLSKEEQREFYDDYQANTYVNNPDFDPNNIYEP